MHSENKARLHRSEVNTTLTWDLASLFQSEEDFLEKLSETEKQLDRLMDYEGRLCTSGMTLYNLLTHLENSYISLVQLGTYVTLKQSEDGTNPKNQERSMTFGSFSTKAQTVLSFIGSEITALSADQYKQLFEECAELSTFKHYLDDIYSEKLHKLSPETERALASLGELTGAPYRIYGLSKAADMVFESFMDHEGTLLPNSFALYESNYEFSKYAELRKNAYTSFNKTLKQYKNTFATVYGTEVRKQVTMSKLRGYESATHMLLDPQKVSVEMYNTQIDLIYSELAPHMRRFANLKKEQLGLDALHFFDLKAPLDPDFNPPATIEDIEAILIEALGILGPDYQNTIRTAFNDRWIDYADNIGKATGAFCASPYGAHSYILITYQDNMRSAFTLAHELGHAGHFTLANAHQRVFDTRPSTYFIEAPSTINEMFLAEYLMKKDDRPRMKRWVILQLLETYYHNFVTHLLEAEFQRRVYHMAENNVPLTAKSLCDTKLNVLRTFWGDSVSIDDEAGMTWMRQPHYYMGLYPYTYSAGLSAATAISRQIFKEGQPAVDRWIETMKTGGALPPKDLLLKAGLDMSTPQPIKVAVDYVGELITELEALFA